MTRSLDQDGIGFDAVWYANFCHHLIGDGNYGENYADLPKIAGMGAPGPLNMDYFAGALLGTQFNKIVYHEDHDEAGNESNTGRTITVAVNQAPLVGETRKIAEDRCRFAFGMSALSAGTPMFLMGEEIGAAKKFRYYDFFEQRRSDRGAERERQISFLLLPGFDRPARREASRPVARTRRDLPS